MGLTGHRVPVATVGFRAYSVPLVRPWRTASGEWGARQGWLVRISDGAGAWGLGDCAPLEASGTESLGAARRACARAGRRWRGRGLAGIGRGARWSPSPAAAAALETAALDLAARRAGLPLCRLLRPGCPLDVVVAAACGGLDPGLTERARAAVAAGFRVLKIKVGGDPLGAASAVSRLGAVLAQAQVQVQPRGAGDGDAREVSLRLDANRAWSLAEASAFAAALRQVRVESLEEPLAGSPPDGLAALQAAVPYPVALDEALAGPDAERTIDTTAAARVVIKAPVVGGLRRGLALAARARRRGLQVVVTSLLESGVGVRAAAHLAAAAGSDLAHGLDTGRWLTGDPAGVGATPGPLLRLRGPGLGLPAPGGAWSSVPGTAA